MTGGEAGSAAPRVPGVVGVLGGGRMGAGIAHAFCLAGARVVIVERDDDAARGARDRVLAALSASIARGATPETLDTLGSHVVVATDPARFAEAALVVEAVPEVPQLKQEALARVEAVVPATAWLASNTSSISITELGGALSRPERFCGLHFFNPVPASRLVEIVAGAVTSTELIAEAKAWVAALGKAPIVARDVPGFASSRLGVSLALEAMRMLEDGVATAADIDAAMELGYGHAAGPLKTTDIVGLDVRLGIAEYLHESLGERFAPPAILRRLVAQGDVGRKSGQGFYEWRTDEGRQS